MADGLELIHHVQELALSLGKVLDLKELYRRCVEGLLSPLGFDRAALFLYDPSQNLMLGTWGTDPQGHLVDESRFRAVVDSQRVHLREALSRPDHLVVKEDQTLFSGARPVGRGWNAIVVLQDADEPLGWLTIDNGLHQRPFTDLQREVLQLYGRTISHLILHRRYELILNKYRSQNELKDKLFTILAHDLRGPIGNLGVLLGMACDQPMDPEDLKEVLSESRQAALRTYGLLENVLGWVRSQIEEVSALRDRIPIRRPLVSVQIWLEAQAKAKGIHLVVDCHESLSVVADERMIETIVRNLVSNAIKYTPRGGSVILRGRADQGEFQIEVVDSGVGMPSERVASLFASRQNKSQPGTAGEGGSGLGLMFSNDLARTLGGRLEAESQLGRGSTFRLVLPDELDGELDDPEEVDEL